MARPVKEGVDYFPLDVAMDTKVELLEAQFGLKGFAVFVKLLQILVFDSMINFLYINWHLNNIQKANQY